MLKQFFQSDKNLFIKEVASYFQNFLETDFRKRRLPKRSIKSTDTNGNQITINLLKYTSFRKKILTELKNPKKYDFSFNFSRNRYTSKLDIETEKYINSNLKSVLDDFNQVKDSFFIKIKDILAANKKDIESFKDEAIDCMIDELKVHLVSKITASVQGTISKNASENDYLELEVNIAEAIFNSFREEFLLQCNEYFKNGTDSEFDEIFNNTVFVDKIEKIIINFFESYSITDLSTELTELNRVKNLKDNLQLYLYLGKTTFKGHSFPLFFIPCEVEEIFTNNKKSMDLRFEKRFVINKQALEFIYQETVDQNTSPISSLTKKRVVDLEESQSILEFCNDLLNKISSTLRVENDFESLFTNLEKGNNELVSISNDIYLSVFEKGDEAAINDYEELLQLLDEDSELGKSFAEIMNDIIKNEPINIQDNIEDKWDAHQVVDKLIFPSPIPVNEEQRKIIKAVNDSNSKYITVEGPPGTGKSHTITAMMFDAIRNKKSVIMLSDKKEALDVVEDKLTSTLEKVRPEEDFQNPILRIGKSGNTYAKIFNREVISKIRHNFRSSETILNSSKFRNNLKNELTQLKQDVNNKIDFYNNINISKLYEQLDLAQSNQLDDKQENEIIAVEKPIRSMLYACDKLFEINSNHEVDISLLKILIEGDFDKNLAQMKDFIDMLVFLSNSNSNTKDLKTYFTRLELENIKVLSSLTKEYEDQSSRFLSILFKPFYLKDWNLKVNNQLQLEKGLSKYWSEKNQSYNFKNLWGYELITSAKTLLEYIKKTSFSVDNTEMLNQFFSEDFEQLYELKEDKLRVYQDFINSIYEVKEHAGSFPDILQTGELDIAITNENFFSISDLKQQLEILKKIISFIDLTIEVRNLYSFNENIRFLDKIDDIHKDTSFEMKQEFDKRFLDFAQHNQATAKAFKKIISKKLRFPKEDFQYLKDAFPCIISGIRDYADYIPLEKDLFDLLIIDEASQVSIAQSFPAILRAKKVVILGDSKQFGNVKSSTASNNQNHAWQQKIKDAFRKEYGSNELMMEKSKIFNIRNSILDFFEYINNYSSFLRKHFRGYPELISFSSKYFYNDGLQTIKVRAKDISEVIVFDQIEHDDLIDIRGNINVLEAEHIVKMLENSLKSTDLMSVGIITPFRDQQRYISALIDKSSKRNDIYSKLKIKVMTFDTCQGEERDHIIYSMVATKSRDVCNAVLGKNFDLSVTDVETSLRLQRLNVGMSRSKEKITFVISKPIEEFKGNAQLILNHYAQEIENAKKLPTAEKTDSEMEKKLLHWISQTKFYKHHINHIELVTQFEVGKYIKSLDSTYEHSNYRCDFLLRYNYDDKPAKMLIIEYDGFEFHFKEHGKVNQHNFDLYYTEQHIEREKILESYGFPFLRLNKFNLGNDPINSLSDKLDTIFFPPPLELNEEDIVFAASNSTLNAMQGNEKWCDKCQETKSIEEFRDFNLISGIGRYCIDCKNN